MSTHDQDDDNEARVRQLFDASAETAEHVTLTRLSARAADIPTQRWPSVAGFPRWAWASSALVLTAVFCLLLTRRLGITTEPPASTVAPPAIAVAPVSQPLIPAPATSGSELEPPGRAAANVRPEALDSTDLLADLHPDLESEPPAGIELDALSGPAADADLDAWLYATNKLLNGT
jgi:hypothetical protein